MSEREYMQRAILREATASPRSRYVWCVAALTERRVCVQRARGLLLTAHAECVVVALRPKSRRSSSRVCVCVCNCSLALSVRYCWLSMCDLVKYVQLQCMWCFGEYLRKGLSAFYIYICNARSENRARDNISRKRIGKAFVYFACAAPNWLHHALSEVYEEFCENSLCFGILLYTIRSVVRFRIWIIKPKEISTQTQICSNYI